MRSEIKRKPVRLAAAAFLLAGCFILPAAGEGDADTLISQGPGVYYEAAGKNALSVNGTGNTQGSSAEEKIRLMENGQKIALDPTWTYADFSVIRDGTAVLYKAAENRKNRCVAVNAGHGTAGGTGRKTYSHPDKTGKVTGGTNAAGAVMSMCVSDGMTFRDGTREKTVTLRLAQLLRDRLLAEGYDVLMIRDGEDVQLDNIARTVIANNMADIHIALHWDGDGLSYDKGIFYCGVPEKLKKMEPVASCWEKHEKLGSSLIAGLEGQEAAGSGKQKIFGQGRMEMDLTQTSYSVIPSVDVELGNQCSAHDDETLTELAGGLAAGVEIYFGY